MRMARAFDINAAVAVSLPLIKLSSGRDIWAPTCRPCYSANPSISTHTDLVEKRISQLGDTSSVMSPAVPAVLLWGGNISRQRPQTRNIKKSACCCVKGGLIGSTASLEPSQQLRVHQISLEECRNKCLAHLSQRASPLRLDDVLGFLIFFLLV